MYRLGAGWGMNIEELAIIGLIIGSIGAQHLYARMNAKIFREGVQFLDRNLDEALQKIVDELPLDQLQGAEPINPIQQMIAQKIAESMNPTIQVKEIQRTEEGKFT